jgi:glycosyltransferase involved in cell wall biosynthesis
MRVVHCITGLSGDGAQRMLLRLADGLQRRGVENFVISLSKREPLAEAFEARGIPVHTINVSPNLQGIAALFKLRSLLSELSPDLLQGWMYHANVLLTMVRPFLFRKVPVAWNMRRGTENLDDLKFATRMVVHANRWLSSRPDIIIYCTSESRQQHEALGFNRERGVVIGNGFDLDQFVKSPNTRRSIRERFGIADTDILIGNIGRDDIAKGRPHLIEAFAAVLTWIPHARLMLVGRGMSETNPELRRLLVSWGVASRVILVGEYSPSSELYPAMDILCSSSVAEGFPNVIAEAMCCEVPCVATDVGNTRELLDGVGVVVPPRSAACLAEALAAVCREGREGWSERGARGRSRIAEVYSLDRVVDEYAQLYNEMIGVGRPSRGEIRGIPSGVSPDRPEHLRV